MYCESIFIGGDIRAELPKGAKRFYDIEKDFKKVSSDLRIIFILENAGLGFFTAKTLASSG